MQSQQKRLKWSRGETAEALEERTDTGITSASVEYMENCIPDIYGNISRRPALKAIPLATGVSANSGLNVFGFSYHKDAKTIPFYITETDIILIAVYPHQAPEFLRIKDGKIVYKYLSDYGELYSGVYVNSQWVAKPISFAQQNNYLIVATESNIVKIQFDFDTGNTFTPLIERWQFSGGWYAPNGTQTKQITTSILPGLAISGHFYNYVFTDVNGNTTMFSNTDTGLDGAANLELISKEIPVGSIIQMPNIGCWFRVEGYYNEEDFLLWSSVTFASVVVKTDDSAPTGAGYICVARNGTTPIGSGTGDHAKIEYWLNGVKQEEFTIDRNTPVYVKCSASQTGYSTNVNIKVKHKIISFNDRYYYVYEWGSWEDAQITDASVRMYGALLTPVADENATDDIISVEYGYENLTPDFSEALPLYPHPKKVLFSQQRLWAGDWAFSTTEEYALVIGSQIARYNDLKNDYNQENEPITLDILTQFKEKVVHLVDYNGLKIFTDSYEYAYGGDGVQKQSGNGALETCEPLVFDSLCLYVDMTGYQIKAMQYEFQSNLFNSSSINQLTPHDLIFFPVAMASYEDKINSTGKYLFVLNKESATNPRLAVCNFVPSNQANIWSRWAFPEVFYVQDASYTFRSPYIQDLIHTKDHPIFMCVGGITNVDVLSYPWPMVIYPAVLDFDADVDMVGTLSANNRYVVATYNDGVQDNWLTIPNVPVAVYSNGEYLFETTTNGLGKIVEDVSEYTNITLGSPINSVIRSHPIDVSGKTKSIKKRIGKARISCHDTPEGAITLNGKTGYMNPAQDYIEYYGVSGMKNEVKYTITNNKGAKFHIESLLMNIEYATLIS